MFWYRRDPDARLGVGVAFTSAPLDLGDLSPRSRRDADLARLGGSLGVPVAIVSQVHGRAVLRVGAPPPGTPFLDRGDAQADALWSTDPDVAVAVRVADCVPICLAAADGSVVAAVHAGRPGLLLGVIGAAVAQVRTVSDAPLHAWVGPHVCASCYEVPAQMAQEAAAALGVPQARTAWGTPALDLTAAAHRQLRLAGVAKVQAVGGCTREEASLPSYRRDGAASGRLIAAVWAQGPERRDARRVAPSR